MYCLIGVCYRIADSWRNPAKLVAKVDKLGDQEIMKFGSLHEGILVSADRRGEKG